MKKLKFQQINKFVRQVFSDHLPQGSCPSPTVPMRISPHQSYKMQGTTCPYCHWPSISFQVTCVLFSHQTESWRAPGLIFPGQQPLTQWLAQVCLLSDLLKAEHIVSGSFPVKCLRLREPSVSVSFGHPLFSLHSYLKTTLSILSLPYLQF